LSSVQRLSVKLSIVNEFTTTSRKRLICREIGHL